MKPVRLLFDENVDAELRPALHRRHPQADIRIVGGFAAPPKRTPDPELLRWCEEHERILVSFDKKTLQDHFADHLNAGHCCFGLVLLRYRPEWRRCLDDLSAIVGASWAEDWIDQIIFVPFVP